MSATPTPATTPSPAATATDLARKEADTRPASPSATATDDAPVSEKLDSPPPPPDGGVQAWMSVAGCFLAVFVQFGLANSFGVFEAYYEQNQLAGYTPSTISWIGGIQQFLLFFGGLFIGRVFDAHGAHVLIIPGSLCLVTSLMLTSRKSSPPCDLLMPVCHTYYQFALAHGVLFGIGSSLVFHPCIAAPGQWFARRRALAMSVAVCGSGLGGTLWPIALHRMFLQIGFAWALRATAFIALGLLAVACALVRTRLPRKPPAPLSQLLTPFKEARFMLLTLAASFMFWGMFTPFFFITPNALRVGANADIAFYCLAFINAGSTVGRLFATVGDYWGRFNVLIVAGAVNGLMLLAFWIPLNSTPQLIAFGVLHGFSAGMVISIIAACVGQISVPQEIGRRIGAMWAVVAVFALTGPPINGALIANYPGRAGYEYAGAFSGCVVLVGAVLALLAKWKASGSVWGIA
ncbi:hypothetical protein Q8F55_002417 [Vanrija albida]|uniref:Major facilitator superfamily (MFS) profile domain-containing protein n=1 Tax=Vanrija albida TaxID=181172 RepID=A0ABR3Q9Q2_9TREE